MFSVSTLRKLAIIGGGFLILFMLHLQTSNTYKSPSLLSISSSQSAFRQYQYLQYDKAAININITTNPSLLKVTPTKDGSNHCRTTTTTTTSQPVVFVKTHKTGSSTISTTLLRYADEKHLKLALPIFTHIFHEVRPFHHRMVLSVGDMKQFDILANHARYNRHEMDQVVHRAVYVTVIRNPIQQLESAFSYFGMANNLGLPDDDSALDLFLKHPEMYFYNYDYHMRMQSWNGQIYDLGLDHQYHLNETAVQKKIHDLDQEINLVMIKEYFDHSMVLLRRLLCLDWMDIIYIAKAVRAKRLRHVITNTLADKISQWNAADMKLYKHFNRTFWRKVDEYGPNFYADLNYFQKLNRNISNICIDTNSDSNYDSRVDAHLLKSDAPEFCFNLRREEVPYTRWIKWRYVCHNLLLPSFMLLSALCTFVYLFRYWYCRGAVTNGSFNSYKNTRMDSIATQIK